MFKLQSSCILIICFLFLLFLMEKDLKKETRKLFSLILVVSVFLVLFEIQAIYTANHVGAVSPVLFKSVHRAYLTLVLTLFYLNFQYMSAFLKEEADLPKKGSLFMNMVWVILYAGIFLLPLGYMEVGAGEEFVYGPGVWIVYVGASFYLFVIFSNYCSCLRTVASAKITPLVLGVGSSMCICFYYMCVPTSNVICLAVTMMNIAMYLSIRHEAQRPQRQAQETESAEYLVMDEKLTEPEEDLSKTKAAIQCVSFEAPKARVLVVDDSDMSRKLLINLLKKTKMQVEEASGGKECLAIVNENTYDLIFMDHLMPDMDGVETFKVLKRKNLCEKTPVIALTANTTDMSEEDYKNMGFAGYIPKPVVPEKMMETVYELLDKALIESVETKEEEQTEPPTETLTETVVKNDAEVWKKLPMVDGLDYTYAALHFPDAESFVETVCFLVEVMPEDIHELQRYYKDLTGQNVYDNFCTKVHSMKNSAMTVGIVPLAGLAKTLEDAAIRLKDAAAPEEAVAAGELENICALMPVFAQKWTLYQQILRGKFGRDPGQKKPGDPNSEEIKALFQKLRSAAEEMDIDELDRVMGEIDTYTYAPEYDEKLQKIRLAVMNFDIDYLMEDGFL